MAAEKRVNYTEAQVAEMIKEYQEGKSVEEIAEAMGKAVRSVRSKLVREGVYVPAEKPAKAKREEGPTKKEMLRELQTLVPFSVDGLMNATKEVIQAITDYAKREHEAEAEAES